MTANNFHERKMVMNFGNNFKALISRDNAFSMQPFIFFPVYKVDVKYLYRKNSLHGFF